MAPFAAPYGVLLLFAVIAAVEAMLTMEPPVPVVHDRQDVPAHQERSTRMDGHHSVPVVERPLLERAELGVAGSVEDAVDLPELLSGGVDSRANRGLVGDVSAKTDGAVDASSDLLRSPGIEVDDRHTTALGGELPSRGRSDAGTSPGGQQDLPVEAHLRLLSVRPWLVLVAALSAPAGYEEVLAGHETSRRRGQEDHGGGDVVGCAETSERNRGL